MAIKLVTYKRPASEKPEPFVFVHYGYGENNHRPAGVGWWDDKQNGWFEYGGPQSQWYDGTIRINRQPDWWYEFPVPESEADG